MSVTNTRYNLTIVPALEESTRHVEFEFESLSEARAARDTTARLLLFLQDGLKVMQDYSNCFVVSKKINDGPWEELN
jgi:hypothetical protein